MTHPFGLQESPTTNLLPTTAPTAVVLPDNDDQQHPTPSNAVVDPADDDILSLYLAKWCDCDDEDFDRSSELDAIAAACERMQRRPTATTTAAPTTQPTAETPTQHSTSPTPLRCICADEDPFSSVIDELVEVCDRMQKRWPTVTTTVAPHHHPTQPTPERDPIESDLLATLASLEELIQSDMDEKLDDRPSTSEIHRLPMSYHDKHVLQTHVIVKLIAVTGDLNKKIALLTAATTRPPKSPIDSTTTATLLPAPRLLFSCIQPSSQQYTVLGFLQPKGPFETLRESILRNQLAPVPNTGTYTHAIPAKPPFRRGCYPLSTHRTKDGMRPP